ncbi:hypothetical protein [Halobacterium sp. CBA1126]|uniref:hypothetical protein n=1 Tax=Halobacterium sp. CBA1126 TaxID=2668074 RepID=UPI0012F72459|nr:hypothetical protein [Halobacterium sp. CBA1126]MUV60397.1 hypothetical protein [Halobacterium sp. CBA1126]
MQRRQFVTFAGGVLAAISGCLGSELGEPGDIEPYDFAVENQTNAEQRANVTVRRDDEVLFETDVELAAHATWEFEGPLEGDGSAFVIVTANGYSDSRKWSRPDGSGMLRADIYKDSVELSASGP